MGHDFDNVLVAQALVAQGLQQALRVTADGQFGRQTAAAVMTIQARYGLDANGIVDPRTWRAVIAQAPR